MKLASFRYEGRSAIGAVDGNEIADLSAAGLPATMLELIEEGPAGLLKAAAARDRAPRIALDQVKLQAPIARPPKILAVGLNYRSHAEEAGFGIPEWPVIFNKQSTSVNGPFDPIHRPAESVQLDYEGELAVVIGKRCRRVPRDHAKSVVAGYAVANDATIRDWQVRVPTMTMGKSWETHCPWGPWIVTTDELADPHQLTLKTWVNGDLRQSAVTSDLIFDCYTIIEHLSTVFTLEPGDLILTGTPAGVAFFRQPQVWLEPGDVVKIEISGIGTIENPIIDEPATTAHY